MSNGWIEPTPVSAGAWQAPAPRAPHAAAVQRQIHEEHQRLLNTKHSTGAWVAAAVGAVTVLALGYWLGSKSGRRGARQEYRAARRAVEEFEGEE